MWSLREMKEVDLREVSLEERMEERRDREEYWLLGWRRVVRVCWFLREIMLDSILSPE